MAPEPETLPNNIDQLKQLVIEFATALESSEHHNQQLTHRLNQLLRNTYGRKSEHINPAQLKLFLEEMKAAGIELEPKETAKEEAPQTQAPEAGSATKGHGRNALPNHLPRQEIEHDIKEEDRRCTSCGSELCHIGEEVSEQLEYVPASLFVKRHIRHKYACKSCDHTVVTAETPEKPIAKGLAGPGLLAQVMVSKYVDHLPLNRQTNIFKRHDVNISRSTMCGWVEKCAELARPLYDAMKDQVMASRVIHTDDTPVPVLDRSRDKTRKGRLWVYAGDKDHPFIIYDYTPNRARDGPDKFFGGYRGYIQADAYAGYDHLFAKGADPPGDKMTEVGCWAHARRKFYDAQDSERLFCTQALAYIRRLYRIEKEAKLLSDDDRRSLRCEDAKPLLKEFHRWLLKHRGDVLPKSPAGGAVTYALNQWDALNTYLREGWLAIDNNLAERALRRVALGRKNWLFAGSDRGGAWAAVIYSLTASAQQHGLNPFAYLRDVFDRMPTWPANKISDFFPDRWVAKS